MQPSPKPTPEDERPFVVPCADLTPAAPLRWLRLGWQDFKREPGLSLVFGGVIVLVSVGVSALAWSLGRFALLATLLSGFVFIAPLESPPLPGRVAPHIPYGLHPIRTCPCQAEDWLRPI